MSHRTAVTPVPDAQTKPPRQPLLWAALAYGAGILAGSYAWRPALWWFVAALAFIGAGAFYVRRRWWLAFPLALGALFFVGALEIQLRDSERPPGTEILPFADGNEAMVTAHVRREGEIRDAGYGGLRETVDLETEEIVSGHGRRQVRAGLRLSIYRDEIDGAPEESGTGAPMRIYRYGERLHFPAKLHPPRNFRNPGAFDYEGYLANEGILVLGSTKSTKVEVLPGFVGTRVAQWRDRIHHSIVRKIHALWSPEDAALVDAAVIGESAFLTPATRVDFQRSGTYHILVVSGMNVSILAFVVFWVMRRLGLNEGLGSGTTVLLCAAYAFVTDVGPPVWRAVLMLTIYLGVRLLYRERSMLNALGAAALGLMVADPRSFRGPSFQLTFLAVFIIAAIAVPLLQRTSQPYLRGLRHLDSQAFDRTLAPRVVQMRLDLRLVAGRLTYLLGTRVPRLALNITARGTLSAYELLCVSSLMQVGLALPMALLLPPGHGRWNPRQRSFRSAHRITHAVSSALRRLELRGRYAGQIGHGGRGRSARDYRRRTLAWRVAHRRPPRGHAGTRHHCNCSRHARHCDGAGPTVSETSRCRRRSARLWRSLG